MKGKPQSFVNIYMELRLLKQLIMQTMVCVVGPESYNVLRPKHPISFQLLQVNWSASSIQNNRAWA